MTCKKTYSNLDDVKLTTTFSDMMRWRKERKDKQKDLSYVVPHAENKQVEFLQTNRTTGTITWIGHCTFLIQKGGLNILTDPVWSKWMGVTKRTTEAGLAVHQLPAIDVVVISHNHYDHLDIGILKRLPEEPLVFVPNGLKKYLLRKGLKHVEEFDWWESKTIDDVEFHFVPAQHWSKRTLFDTNRSHWGGWVIQLANEGDAEQARKSIYFVGDSGYFRGFQLIGERFDIGHMLVPIGAYEPEWFMKIQHVTPEEAVQAYLDAGATYFLPMHHDSYRLGDDTSQEALERLQCEWERRKLEHSHLKLLALGETNFLNHID